jgi:hypothetical protein
LRASLVLALAAACSAAPPARPPISSGSDVAHVACATEACVKQFVAREPLHGRRVEVELLRVPRKGGDDERHYYLFSVMYGAAHDCEAGCFYSHAYGIALYCDRIGWYGVADYEQTDTSRLTLFRPQPGDTLLYDDTLWPDETIWRLREWLSKQPGVPDDVRAKAGAPPPKPTIDI